MNHDAAPIRSDVRSGNDAAIGSLSLPSRNRRKQ